MSRLRVKPVETPVTILLTSARVVPHIARACLLSLFGAIVTAPSATVAATSLLTTRLSVPSRPFAVSVWPARSTVTSCGIATGFLPIRDILFSSHLRRSEHPAQYLAADLHGAGLVVGQDPARR